MEDIGLDFSGNVIVNGKTRSPLHDRSCRDGAFLAIFRDT